MKIIPFPVSCKETGEKVSLSGVFHISTGDERLHRASERLKPIFSAGGNADITLIVEEKQPTEGYSLSVSSIGVKIVGNSATGAFWGLQTLQQIVTEYGVDSLPGCEIEDYPALRERGFYHDISRGKVPTLDTLKDLVDRLAYFKINSLQLYIEHAFAFPEYEGIVSKENQLTAKEIRELDEYCYERFIELVPSLSTFGHLYLLLQSDRYRHLCELENYIPKYPWFIERMEHHTIDAYNPQSIELIGSLIRQYAVLFRSRRFNICCDETFDLCNGRNKGKDKGEAYLHFLLLILEEVHKCGKQPMMWGDILLKYPEVLERLPKDVVVLNWEYSPTPDKQKITAIADLYQPQILCCATLGWDDAIPELANCIPNITAMARYARQYGTDGILNTNWGDYCNIGGLEAELYPMAVGAACGWNPDTEIDERFESAAACHLYGDQNGKSVALIKELSLCHKGHLWTSVCLWQTGCRQVEFLADDLKKRIDRLSDIFVKLQELKGKIKQELIEELLLAVRHARMFCVVLLKGLGESAELPEPVEEWLSDFAMEWLRKNKESELPQILDYMRLVIKQAEFE